MKFSKCTEEELIKTTGFSVKEYKEIYLKDILYNEYKEDKYDLKLLVSLNSKKLLSDYDIYIDLKLQEFKFNENFKLLGTQKTDDYICYQLNFIKIDKNIIFIIYLKEDKRNIIDKFEKLQYQDVYVFLIGEFKEFGNSKYFISSDYNKINGIGILASYNKKYHLNLVHLNETYYLNSNNIYSHIFISNKEYKESELLPKECVFVNGDYQKVFRGNRLGRKYINKNGIFTYVQPDKKRIYLRASMFVNEPNKKDQDLTENEKILKTEIMYKDSDNLKCFKLNENIITFIKEKKSKYLGVDWDIQINENIFLFTKLNDSIFRIIILKKSNFGDLRKYIGNGEYEFLCLIKLDELYSIPKDYIPPKFENKEFLLLMEQMNEYHTLEIILKYLNLTIGKERKSIKNETDILLDQIKQINKKDLNKI